MTTEQVKNKIKTKFGSISRFARIANLDRYELQKLFGRTNPNIKDLQKVLKLAQGSQMKTSGKEISPEQVAALKQALEEYGGVIKFSRDHPEFGHKVSIFQILSGHRKRTTDKVRELFTHFKIPTE